jgi:hypothetical protein
MRPGLAVLTMVGWFLCAQLAVPADEKPKRTPKQALKAFNDLIGSWKGTGIPEGPLEVQQRDFWTEKLSWEWQFKRSDAWLKVAIDKGKYFTKGELRYLPDKDQFQLTLETTAKESLTFTGPYKEKERVLSLERTDDKKKESQRLVFSFIHGNRFLYRYEVKPEKRRVFAKKYQVGATKDGVAFASGDGKPECVVSGGLGKITVTYKGKTYYVCCTGCRDAFKEDPERYIKEYEERQKAKEKDR